MPLLQKRMASDEAAAFEDKFDALFMSLRSPQHLALFLRHDPDDADTEILLVADEVGLTERLSPGGWHDAQEPQEHKWMHLVGHDGVAGEYGLELGIE